MKHLIIYAHPFENSFCYAIMRAYEESLQNNAHQVETRNLYANNFNPVLCSNELIDLEDGIISSDVRKEQEYIEKAEVLTFIYPTWWSGMPAILKGYIERVFCESFAYRITPDGTMPLLTDKKVFILATKENTSPASPKNEDILEAVKVIEDSSIFEFCGMEVLKHKFIDIAVSYEDRLKALDYVRKLVLRFFN